MPALHRPRPPSLGDPPSTPEAERPSGIDLEPVYRRHPRWRENVRRLRAGRTDFLPEEPTAGDPLRTLCPTCRVRSGRACILAARRTRGQVFHVERIARARERVKALRHAADRRLFDP